MHRLAFLASMLVLLTVCPPSASTHVKTDQGRWLFTGSTYKNDASPPQKSERGLPVNVILRGPSSAFINDETAMGEIENNWSDRHIPGKYPRGHRMKDRGGSPACSDTQWVFMRRGNAANVGQAAPSTNYLSTDYFCAFQYHIRLWSSSVHDEIGRQGAFAPSHRANTWALVPIHHEHPTPKHKIDQPLDATRSVFIHAMKKTNCYVRKWAVHPESAGFKYGASSLGPYTGIITRISMHHRADGRCKGVS